MPSSRGSSQSRDWTQVSHIPGGFFTVWATREALYLAPLLHEDGKGKGGSSDRFPLLGLKNHCRRWLQPWNRQTIASWQQSDDKHRQCVEKHRHYSADKVHRVKAMVFPVVRYGCESWTVKKAERQKINASELWCWRRLLKVPWTARSNQWILREINPEYSLEGLMLKLKLQYFGHLMWTDHSLDKSLMLGKIEGGRSGHWRMSWLDSITNAMKVNLVKLQETVRDSESMGWQRVRYDWETGQQQHYVLLG